MKQSFDLNTFAETMTDKGYNGLFLTQAGYPGKVKDSISSFLEACRKGTDKPLFPGFLTLNTYLEWSGEDKPKVSCHLRVQYRNDNFEVQKMNIEKTDRYGHSMKKLELANLTMESVPTVKEALSKLSDKPEEQLSPRRKGLGM